MAHGLAKSVSLLVALALGTAAGALAQDGPQGYTCVFDSGQTWTHEGGKFQSAPAATLKFDIEKIDLEKQSAKLVLEGKQTGELRIVRALNANSFLEVAQEGFLNLTTVYDKDATSGNYPAVHSRHLGLLGQPIFAQYPGTCTAR